MSKNVVFLNLLFFIMGLYSTSAFSLSEKDANPNHWIYFKKTDDFTDKISSFSMITAKEGINDGFIILSCKGGNYEEKISVGVLLSEAVNYANYENVKYRIDSKPPASVKMDVFQKMAYSTKKNSKIITALANGNSKVVIQMLTSSLNQKKSNFSLSGSTKAINRVLKDCS